ncbi:MAG: bifunctional hydroxymethylpyrimidine kinase/phosphomethylpyrimidine kinase [Verrucomicrobiae bacterium]|nr:bifunctional hydroxymethylpyrimidine kinase/phosphomethylpyrimidine kinase [Verrucomicrobiae bacterium]
MNSSPPIALTIAGSDSSAGAGLQADLKAFAANGVYGVCAVTAVVAEAPGSVMRAQPVDPTLLRTQLESVASTFPVAAYKTGMLANGDLVGEVVSFARTHPELPLVVDPVLVAGAGSVLLDDSGLDRLRSELLPVARLVTPNLLEAEALLGASIRSMADFASAPRQIHERYGCQVLLKAGHFSDNNGSIITDRAWIDGEAYAFSRPRLNVPDVHGTGCMLSAAITARLALGGSMAASIEEASRYLSEALARHHRWTGPRGGIEALNAFPDGLQC